MLKPYKRARPIALRANVGDVLEIRTHLVKVGTKSITVLYEMINLAKDEVAATLESVCVYFDLEERRAIPLTEEMRQQSLPFLET